MTVRAATLLLATLLAGASAGTGGCSSGSAPATAQAAAPQLPATPQRFRRIEGTVRAGLVEADRGDGAAVRARGPEISSEGLALIQAVLPHDVSRTDVPRYLEGRAAFGAALKQWVGAVESGTDAEVIAALRALDGALRGWIDAYLGLAPETSV